MNISGLSTPELEQTLAVIVAERAHRRDPVKHGIPDEDRNEHFAAMGDGSLEIEEKYVRREVNLRAGEQRRTFATIVTK